MRANTACMVACGLNQHSLPSVCNPNLHPTGQPAGGSGACVGSPFLAVTSLVSADRLDVYYLVAPRLV